MTDVLKIALDRRAQLHKEVAKLDEFIRMAETLMSNSQGIAPVQSTQSSDSASQAEPAMRTAIRRSGGDTGEAAEAPRPSIIRRSANAAG